mmetsp:Transcript_42311/g.106641  ORF Transcript_42311/g.106641 Transcript_42311/m.106641 type:complete len:223 (-) Transcript_42311:7-675(-)
MRCPRLAATSRHSQIATRTQRRASTSTLPGSPQTQSQQSACQATRPRNAPTMLRRSLVATPFLTGQAEATPPRPPRPPREAPRGASEGRRAASSSGGCRQARAPTSSKSEPSASPSSRVPPAPSRPRPRSPCPRCPRACARGSCQARNWAAPGRISQGGAAATSQTASSRAAATSTSSTWSSGRQRRMEGGRSRATSSMRRRRPSKRSPSLRPWAGAAAGAP